MRELVVIILGVNKGIQWRRSIGINAIDHRYRHSKLAAGSIDEELTGAERNLVKKQTTDGGNNRVVQNTGVNRIVHAVDVVGRQSRGITVAGNRLNLERVAHIPRQGKRVRVDFTHAPIRIIRFAATIGSPKSVLALAKPINVGVGPINKLLHLRQWCYWQHKALHTPSDTRNCLGSKACIEGNLVRVTGRKRGCSSSWIKAIGFQHARVLINLTAHKAVVCSKVI